ncbi:MAG: ABC transporter permease [Proteobacteria bacterium]|nr:ABC transporter permease [Pseudomonadota bacterium]
MSLTAGQTASPDTLPARPGPVRVWSQRPVYVLLATGPALFLAALFLLPLAHVVVKGFAAPASGPGNYTRIVTGGPYLPVMLGTLETALMVTAVCLVLAYPLAFVGSRLQGRLYTVFMALILIPLFTSVVVRSYAWMVLFQRSGPINQTLVTLGFIESPIRLLQTPFAVTVGMVHVLLPMMVLPILTSMRSLDGTLLQAGEIMGASPARVFVRIFVPMTLPGASAGIILVFISALGFFVTPALLGGARSTMIAVLIEQQAVDLLNWPMASALATMLLVTAVLIYMGYSRLTRRFNEMRA